MKEVSIDKLIKDLEFEVIYKSTIIDVNITKSDINRPGLQLTGYFAGFPHQRLQIIGNVEWKYLSTLADELRDERIDKLFGFPIPAIIITRDLELFPEMIKYAQIHNRIILRTNISTTRFINKLISYLEDMLAPQILKHGVLVEVFGMGVLIIGKSGVGKSETALELIKKGHRLIADDAVQISRVDDGRLKGMSPEIIKYFLEIRGIGIIDIKRLFGVSAVKSYEVIDLVVELEIWDKNKEYDRLGLDEQYCEILGIKIPKYVIPVRPGRNLAMIIEVAARNNREKQMGYNAANELNKKVLNQVEND